MNISIKKAISELGISRSKLYKVLKKTQVQTHRKGRESFISLDDFSLIESFLKDSTIQTQVRQVEVSQGVNRLYPSEQAHLNEIERLKKENKDREKVLTELLNNEREENKQLAISLGQWQWQGRAKTIEDQHTKLLEKQSTFDEEQKKGFFARLFGK